MHFPKTLVLSVSALALIGIGLVGAKLDVRAKVKSIMASKLCDNVPCIHLAVRRMAIESVIAQRGETPSYLMIGDSITEMADLPPICGRLPINAGISGATVQTFLTEGARFAGLAKPDFIIVALGANDAITGQIDEFQQRYQALLRSLQSRVIVVPVPPSPKIPNIQRLNHEIAALPAPKARALERVETIEDGVHLAASSYVEWKKVIAEAAQVLCF